MADNEDFEDAAQNAANADEDEGIAQTGTTFALSPAKATSSIIRYGSKYGTSLWKEATEPLTKGEGFDCTPEGLRDFLELVSFRGTIMGWDTSVLSIPEDPEVPEGSATDFIPNYGSLEVGHLRDVASTYLGTDSRVAQDSFQLYACLQSSLSDIGRNKVTIHRKEYMVNGQASGILFLKLIIGVSSIDTNATTTSIRNQLINVDTYLAKVNYDVTKTNQHVTLLLESLRARGETTHDLLHNLFRAYKTVKDNEFIRYITQKESDYEENDIDMSAERLMHLAENKYKTLVEKGQWRAPSAEEEKIVALQSELQTLKNKRKKDNGGGNKASNKQSGGTGNKSGNKRQDNSWMKVPPKEGEAKSKQVEGKQWHWCEKHEKWCLHTTAQCKGVNVGGQSDAKRGNNRANTSSNKTNGRNPRLVRAQKATVRFADNDSSSDEE